MVPCMFTLSVKNEVVKNFVEIMHLKSNFLVKKRPQRRVRLPIVSVFSNVILCFNYIQEFQIYRLKNTQDICATF